MDASQALRILEHRDQAVAWLRQIGIDDCETAWDLMNQIAVAGMPADLMGVLYTHLQQALPDTASADMGFCNVLRFVLGSRSPMGFACLCERDPDTLPTLLQIVSCSQQLADDLIQDPESFDLLRLTEGQPVAREVLIKELLTDIEPIVANEREAIRLMRQFRRREMMRIAFGDLVRKLPVDTTARQTSYLADAVCQAALHTAWAKVATARGPAPQEGAGIRRFVILGFGRHGGMEMNYGGQLQIAGVYEGGGRSDGARSARHQEYYDRVMQELIRVLTEDSTLGPPLAVDVSSRPGGSDGPLVISAKDAVRYYDVSGRTWERQGLVKARVVAGDVELGETLLGQLQHWVYRRYLSAAEIAEIRSLKRRIEERHDCATATAMQTVDKGIDDVEFIVQFLQLLNGAELPRVRTTNTLEAVAALEQSGCLTMQERSIFEQNYDFLRSVKHRAQSVLSSGDEQLSSQDWLRLAMHWNFTSAEQLTADINTQAAEIDKVIGHLLHDTFGDEATVDPETDLVLDPKPSPERLQQVLAPYPFRDVSGAYRDLMALATEQIPFLSPRRCRYFLASIARPLLEAIAKAPDPDATIASLARVSDSIGGKAVLWELVSVNPPTLEMYVRLCATSPYLSDILTSHPGMIDELMDSLILEKLPSRESLQQTLEDLCQGAEDQSLIIHSFKNANHLRVGVRDILQKDDVKESHRALSDIAEVCLRKVTDGEFEQLVTKHGRPMQGEGQARKPCEFIIVALGKLGGREPNYHSDLDVLFLYESDGKTQATAGSGTATSNQYFFCELGKRILKAMNHLGPTGKLFDMDRQVRPSGEHGPLAVSLDQFARYMKESADLSERQALCKARVVYGSESARATTDRIMFTALTQPPVAKDELAEIRRRRLQLEETASERNLKRMPGGTMDIEFIVQMRQMQTAQTNPDVWQTGTLDALDALAKANQLSDDDQTYLAESYRFLRRVEAGLRLMNTSARHDLPGDAPDADKLAYLLHCSSAAHVTEEVQKFTRENRVRFERLCNASSVSV